MQPTAALQKASTSLLDHAKPSAMVLVCISNRDGFLNNGGSPVRLLFATTLDDHALKCTATLSLLDKEQKTLGFSRHFMYIHGSTFYLYAKHTTQGSKNRPAIDHACPSGAHNDADH